jgi:hypothetical protein
MRLVFVCLAACASSKPVENPMPSKACTSPEHRQFDFWIGDWDVALHVRTSPTEDTWQDATGTQHVEAILGGCAISETFSARGPGEPWAGRSFSMWQPAAGTWRQTWVDDQGSYLAFTGGIEHGVMTLYGEPRDKDGKRVQMRMQFLDVTPRTLRWEWQRSDDAWQTSTVMMRIDYRRL